MPIPTLTVTPPPRRCATIASLPLPPIAGAERQNSDAAPTPLLTARTTKHDHPAATSGSNTTISNQRVADAGLDATMVARRREIGQDPAAQECGRSLRTCVWTATARQRGQGAGYQSCLYLYARTHPLVRTQATQPLLRQRYAACLPVRWRGRGTPGQQQCAAGFCDGDEVGTTGFV